LAEKIFISGAVLFQGSSVLGKIDLSRFFTKKLHRQYRNVFDDVKILERLGLVEKTRRTFFRCVR
jgi:hypothetical protein